MSQAGSNSSTGGGGGTNGLSGSAISENGSTEDLITIQLDPTGTVYRFYFMIVGREASTDDGLGYHLFASGKTDGVTASLIQTEFVDADEDAALGLADIALVPSANTLILQVTGVAGTTINYLATGNYISI